MYEYSENFACFISSDYCREASYAPNYTILGHSDKTPMNTLRFAPAIFPCEAFDYYCRLAAHGSFLRLLGGSWDLVGGFKML